MIDPNFYSLYDILKKGRPRIFVMNIQVEHFGHVHYFLFVQWPYNNNLVETIVSLDIF